MKRRRRRRKTRKARSAFCGINEKITWSTRRTALSKRDEKLGSVDASSWQKRKEKPSLDDFREYA